MIAQCNTCRYFSKPNCIHETNVNDKKTIEETGIVFKKSIEELNKKYDCKYYVRRITNYRTCCG